jgi:carboxyl-terminal processing protease
VPYFFDLLHLDGADLLDEPGRVRWAALADALPGELIVGRRTFGKGVVQTVLPLDADHAVKLTTARYYTPNGTSIQAEGIKPDIALAELTVNQADSEPELINSEADLKHHLANENTAAAQDIDNDGSAENAKLATQDYTLAQALNILKGLALGHRTGTAQ